MKKQLKGKLMMAAAAAASAGAFYAWKRGKKKAEGDNPEDSCGGDGITMDKLKEYLSRLFSLYADGECACEENGGQDLWKQNAEYYAEMLYPYIKDSMGKALKVERTDGKEPFNMTDELFTVPASRIYSEPVGKFHISYQVLWEMELWMLEDGRFALVDFLSINKDGEEFTYRHLDRYVSEDKDIPFAFKDLVTRFAAFA